MKKKKLSEKDWEETYPEALRSRERQFIRKRRSQAQSPSDKQEASDGSLDPTQAAEDLDPLSDAVGFALSGGGIRSATFALGIFQALAHLRLLKKIDFISTVSGGGYFGSFLGRLFTRASEELEEANSNKSSTEQVSEAKAPIELVEKILENSQSQPVAWLRENGRYLFPNGNGDLALSTAIFLRNWLVIQIVLIVSILVPFLFLDLISYASAGLVNLAHPIELSQAAFHGFYLSTFIFVPILIFLFGLIPLASAYWIIQDPQDANQTAFNKQSIYSIAAFTILLGLFAAYLLDRNGWQHSMPLVVTCVLGIIFLMSVFAWYAWHIAKDSKENRVWIARNHLSNWLSWALIGALLSLGFTLIDSLGQSFYFYLHSSYSLFPSSEHLITKNILYALLIGIMVIVAFSQKIVTLLSQAKHSPYLRTVLKGLATLSTLILTIIILALISTLAHGLIWGAKTPNITPLQVIQAMFLARSDQTLSSFSGTDSQINQMTFQPEWIWLILSLAATGYLTYLFASNWSFLNQSSLYSFYSARLARAYLGASNPRRWNNRAVKITESIEGDRISMNRYAPHLKGGPLHLINVTINETVGGKSQVEQRDRKGIGMAIGPAGISVGVRHHAAWLQEGEKLIPPLYRENSFQVFIDRNKTTDPRKKETDRAPITIESLDLAQWTSISGAAFSTGIGSKTTLGLSLLCGFLNIRLGYWWDSGINPTERGKPYARGLVNRITRLFGYPMQIYLIEEFISRFYGTAHRRWYLSDGGHFENMGGYELIRRRLPFIVICDAEQDLDYSCGGLANFIRKARIDFDTKIEFFSTERVSKHVEECVKDYIWENEEIYQSSQNYYKHAALAQIYYPCGKTGTLLYIKTSLSGDEPLDLTQYHNQCPEFPQEPTSDQFFDEEQWESYRELGYHIGISLFKEESKKGQWVPRSFKPIAADTKKSSEHK